MEKGKLGYLSSLDLLRGLAALAVCFFHFTHGNPDFLSKQNVLYQVGRYGFLGVDVFFVISGFVIPYSMYRGLFSFRKIGLFLGKRFIRIEPPYILSIIMVVALNWISTLSPYYKGATFSIDAPALALHFGYLNAFFDYPWVNDVYWTLAIEFQYYILIALIFPLLVHPKKWIAYTTLIAFGSLGFFITRHSLIFNYGFLFIVGILLFQYRIGYLEKAHFGAMLLISLLIIFIKFDHRYLIAALLPYFFITYFVFTDKISKFLGNISYFIYLIYIPIGGRIINLTETFVQDELIRSLFVFVAMAVSIFGAWIFYKIIEKPSMELAKKITYTKKETVSR